MRDSQMYLRHLAGVIILLSVNGPIPLRNTTYFLYFKK